MPPLLPDFISTSVCKLKVRKIVDTTKSGEPRCVFWWYKRTRGAERSPGYLMFSGRGVTR